MRQRNAEKTRETILDAAEKLFAREGIHGVAMSELAKAARVPASLIHHHFGTKERLWRAVTARLDARADALTEAAVPSPPTVETLTALVTAYFHALQADPAPARLNAWRRLQHLNKPGARELQPVNHLRELVEALQRQGALRPDFDPEHLLAILITLTQGWFLAREDFARLGRRPASSDRLDEAYLQSMLRIVFEGATPR